MTFEIIVAKGEIAQNNQFLLFPQCFLLFLIIQLKEMFHVFANKFSKSTAVDLLYEGKYYICYLLV